jgi:cytochrome c-type biogenesis protein CcmI
VTTGIQIAFLVLAVLAATSCVALPFVRPPADAGEQPALGALDESRARLFAALEELGRDRKAGMISEADFATAVGEIRRRLARL